MTKNAQLRNSSGAFLFNMRIKGPNWLIFCSCIAAFAFTACNRALESKIDTSAVPDTTTHQAIAQNKVLYIVVDGGIGKVMDNQSVRDNVYPHINAITKAAIFSGASLTDINKIEATTYADMFTGVRKAKHGVTSASGANNLGQYRSFVANLTAVNASYKTSAFVQSDFIYNNLVNTAATKQLLNSDQSVQTAVTADLVTTASSVVVAQYTGLKKAGDAGGYGPNSAAYLGALQSFDSFLGTLLNAIKSRPAVSSENWVVIVASNKGGKYTLAENEDDGSDFSDTERNGFIIISNPNFNLDYYPVPDLKDYSVSGTSPEQLGPADRQGVLDSASARIYNIGTTGGYTIQFKANLSTLSNSSTLPSIIAKSNAAAGGSPTVGWSVVLHGDGRNNWSFRIGSVANAGPIISLGVWNTFTVRVYDSINRHFVRTFLNGASVSAPSDITTTTTGTTNSAFIIGGGPSYGGNSFRGRIFDVRIYNTALPESYITGNYCKTYVNSDEPYVENLIGYWPGIGIDARESSEKVFLDFSPSKRDIKFGSAAVWSGINVPSGPTICTVYPEKERSKLPYTVDIPRFIYTWLGIFNVSQYNLDGKLITPTYKTTGSSN